MFQAQPNPINPPEKSKVRRKCKEPNCKSVTNRVCDHGYCPNHCMEYCVTNHICTHYN